MLSELVKSEPFLQVRPYAPTDYPMLTSWWADKSETCPTPEMIPTESSFILELNNIPALAVSLILNNTRAYATVDYLVGNPTLVGPDRRRATRMLLKYLEVFAQALGYERLFCIAYRPKTLKYYQGLGFQVTLSGATTLVKELSSAHPQIKELT